MVGSDWRLAEHQIYPVSNALWLLSNYANVLREVNQLQRSPFAPMPNLSSKSPSPTNQETPSRPISLTTQARLMVPTNPPARMLLQLPRRQLNLKSLLARNSMSCPKHQRSPSTQVQEAELLSSLLPSCSSASVRDARAVLSVKSTTTESRSSARRPIVIRWNSETKDSADGTKTPLKEKMHLVAGNQSKPTHPYQRFQPLLSASWQFQRVPSREPAALPGMVVTLVA